MEPQLLHVARHSAGSGVVLVAYIAGFFIMLGVWKWHPDVWFREFLAA